MSDPVEDLARRFHAIYQAEAKRQGDVRHHDDYDQLPENIKEFDRVLAREVLAEYDRLRAALAYYADPMTYFGIAMFGDAPHGDFLDDFEKYPYPGDYSIQDKPGARARAALRETDEFGAGRGSDTKGAGARNTRPTSETDGE